MNPTPHYVWAACGHVRSSRVHGPVLTLDCAFVSAGAHYYTVIRQPSDGTLRSLDFGPVGGRDIAFTPARQSLWEWGRKRLSGAPPPPKGTPGEVREMMVGARHTMPCTLLPRAAVSLLV